MGVIIGSQCIRHWFPDFEREPKDLDIFCGIKQKNVGGIEWFVNDVFDYYKKYNFISDHTFMLPDDLYTLKMSHLIGWNIFWNKNEYDANFLREKGCKLNRELFDELYLHWCTVHGENKRSDLDMTAEEFFDNALDNSHLHDSTHELLIQHPYFEGQEKPTYFKILKDGAEVDVCMEKFANLSEKEKFNVAFEEIAVMAWERWPRLYYKASYQRMLGKFIREHAKLEEALWILENYKNLLTNIPFNFTTWILQKSTKPLLQ